MSSSLNVHLGMAEVLVGKGPATILCKGLGSSIALAALDPVSDVWGTVHFMLPKSFRDKPVARLGQFADTGIKEMLRAMKEAGADTTSLAVAYVGGAQVSKFGTNGVACLDLGARNAAAIAELVLSLGIHTVASDVGGSNGRALTVDTASGEVKFETVTAGMTLLCNLRSKQNKVAA